MTEREAFSIIRNVIRLEGVARRIAVESSKELRRALKTVREVIANMPEGSVERELAYKQLRDFIAATMERPTQRLQVDTAAGLQGEAPVQAEWANKYVDLDPPIDNSLTRAALNGVDQAKVADKPLDTIFKGLQRAQMKKIDAVVREGFLIGMNNTQIANALGGSIKGLQSQQRAIARTAVMSMAQQTHNQVWDANADVIEGWVFDASMDFRVCPECAPLDGKTNKRRSALPEPPIHPNCRCMVLPTTGIDTDTGGRSMVVLSKEKPVEGLGVRVYKQQVTVKGKKFWKVARDVPADKNGNPMTMGGFLQRASRDNKIQVLGGSRTGRYRALVFEERVQRQGGLQRDPDEVLREVVKLKPPEKWQPPKGWTHSL